MIIWVLVVLVTFVLLVFITINKNSADISTEENKMEEVQKEEGVKITIQEEGSGELAEAGNQITVNYTGMFEDGTSFDSNIDPKFGHVAPFTFVLGQGQVIKGWDIGVEGMKVGEKRKLEIRSDYAYGEYGAGGVIPPNTDLVFEVELVSVSK